MHRSDCMLPYALRRGTRPFKAVTAVLLSLPALIIFLLLLDRHREDKRAAEASLRRARAALGSGPLKAWPCALDLPRKTSLGELLKELRKEDGAGSKNIKKGKEPQQVLVYHRRVLPRFWTPAPPLPPSPSTAESLWTKIKAFMLSLGANKQKEQQQQQQQHGRAAAAKPAAAGTSAPISPGARNDSSSRGLGPPMSSLASIVGTLWDVKAQHGGIFKTSVAGLKHQQRTSQQHGGWACELVYNPGRADKPMNLPTADTASLPVRLPFDPSRFGFEKASALDLLFFYRAPELEEHAPKQRALEEAAAAAAANNTTSHPLACSRFNSRAEDYHAVLVNPFPIGALSGVIAPFVLERRPQDLHGAEDALRIALAFAADASKAAAVAPASSNGAGAAEQGGGGGQEQEPRRTGLRVGYNSMSACATVNHLHFQYWHFDLSPDGLLPLERAPRVLVPPPAPSNSEEGVKEKEAKKKDGDGSVVKVYRIDEGYPLRALMLRAPTLPLLARAGSKCLDVLLERDVPHSLLMDGERLFIVPRQKFSKALPFAVSPGFPEASGLLLVMNEQDFADEGRINADLVWQLWAEDMAVAPEAFDGLLAACVEAAASVVAR